MPISQAYGTPHAIWVPIYGDVYNGACVCRDKSAVADDYAMIQFPVASGHMAQTNIDTPFGAVIGNNLRRPLYSAAGKCEYISYVSPHDSTTEYVSTGGHLAAGAREAMVKCTLIDPTTILRTNLVVTAPGTPPTEETVATTDTNGLSGDTVATTDCTPLDGLCTYYVRKGKNAGQYRIMDTVSTTEHDFNIPMYADMEAGDTVLVVNLPLFGYGKCQLAATYCNCFDIADGCGTNSYTIDVIRLNLAEKGNEYCEFRWNIMNFGPYATQRAS